MGDNTSQNDEVVPQQPQEQPPPTPEEIATPDIVQSIVKAYNPEYEVVDFTAKLGSKVGDNYMSIMYAVDIEMKNRKSGERQRLSVMLKTMPRNPLRQQMINDSAAFVKEANMYQQVLPKLIQFQKDKGLKDEDIFKGWPECYVTFLDGKTDYLALQNLKEKGYGMGNRHLGLDVEHAIIVLKGLAKFHALSFAQFGGDRDKMMSEYPWLEEKMFQTEDKVQEQMKAWLKTCFANEAETVKKEGFENEGNLLAKVVDEGFFEKMNDLLEGVGMKNAVIQHGDAWTNNMLFEYDDNKKPKGIKFIDFQLTRCCPRSVDLAYFFHSSLPIPILNSKETDLLKLYHDEFVKFVKMLGVDVDDDNLSLDTFLKEYKDYKFYGVMMGFMLAPILSADANDVPDMETLKEEDFAASGVEEFFEQLTGSTKIESNKKIVNLAVHHLPKCPQVVAHP